MDKEEKLRAWLCTFAVFIVASLWILSAFL